MRCEEFRRELDETGEITSPAARDHLAACADCARAVALWEEARAALRELDREATPPFLHARVMAHLRAAERERLAPRRPWRLAARGVAALAALLAISFAGWIVWRVAPEAPVPVETKAAPRADERTPEPAPVTLPPPLPEAPPAPATASPPRAPSTRPAPVAQREEAAPAEEAIPVMEGQAKPAAVAEPSATPPALGTVAEGGAAPPAHLSLSRRATPERETAEGTRAARAQTARQPGGEALAMAARYAAATRSVEIACILFADTGEPPRSLTLPEPLAPAPGAEIGFTLLPDGELRFDEPLPEGSEPGALAERLRRLALSPGDYRLRRDG
ncbi:MAG TPA: hypothetical protein PKX99_00490 [Thermoanaerobaculia bacterium]|nr:hypothetical protein [Thermoanaerobaculia bacterium]